MPKDKGGLVRASQYPQLRPYTLTNDQRPLFEIVLVCRSFSRNLHYIHRLDTLSLSLWKAFAFTLNMAETTQSNAELLEWPKKDKRRFLHVVYRVGDLDRTIKFYTECFGMKLLRKRDIPEEKYANAFLGFGPEQSHFVVELTYNYGVTSYDIGTGFGHFAIATPDVYKLVEDIRAKGGNVTREPGPVKGGKSVIAFVKDPDGYAFELIQRPSTPEPLCQVMLRVGDLERSIKFYEKVYIMAEAAKLVNNADVSNPTPSIATIAKLLPDVSKIKANKVYRHTLLSALSNHLFDVYCSYKESKEIWDSLILKYIVEDLALGLRVVKKTDRPEYKYTIAMLGYAEEHETTVLELTYNYGVTEYTKGNAYAQVAIGTDDVYKSAEVVNIVTQELGGKITRQPGPIPGLNTKITAFLDPDGWKTVLVDNQDFLKELE
ncbi:putative lactoylglutathione lyase [Glycine max]|nr:putative lactoylglutathione lyase [Glycine max]